MGLNPMTANIQCLTDGCQLQRAAAMVRQAADMQRQAQVMLAAAMAERNNMSSARWCDAGGHAFSERDPGRQKITIQVLGDDGEEQEDAREFCGPHAAAAGLTAPRVTRPKELADNGAEDRR